MLTISMRAARIGMFMLLPLGGAPFFAPASADAQVSVGLSVNIAPPILPVYAQPPLPAPGYIWTPGYWAWNPVAADYYWVPGAWVLPPRVGLLWTPGYWGWVNGAYLFHAGYWGPTVGFYGGVNYGFGYTGAGFFGGQWRGGQYYYNSSVNNVRNVNVTNVYNKTVVVNQNAPRTSFNGGPNGITARPTPAQLAAARAPHVAPTAAQVQHVNLAKADPASRFSANHGAPAHLAAARPLGPAHGAALGGGGHGGAEVHAAGAHPPGAAPRAAHPGGMRAAAAHPGAMQPGGMHPGAMRPGATRPGPMRPQPMMARRPPPRMAMMHPGPRPGPRPGGCRGPRCR